MKRTWSQIARSSLAIVAVMLVSSFSGSTADEVKRQVEKKPSVDEMIEAQTTQLLAKGVDADTIETIIDTIRPGLEFREAMGDHSRLRRRYRDDPANNPNPDEPYVARLFAVEQRYRGTHDGYNVLRYLLSDLDLDRQFFDPYAIRLRHRLKIVNLLRKHYIKQATIYNTFPHLIHNCPFIESLLLLQEAQEKNTFKHVKAAARFHQAEWFQWKATIPKLRQQWRRKQGHMTADQEVWIDEYLAALQAFEEVKPQEEFQKAVTAATSLVGKPGAVSMPRKVPFDDSRNRGLVIDQSGMGDYRRTKRFPTYSERAEALLFELQHLMIGRTAPEISGNNADDKLMKLSDFKGKVTLLTFSADWDGAFRGLNKVVHSLLKAHQNDEFAVVSVRNDKAMQDVLAERGEAKITWPFWYDGWDGPISQKWNIRDWPATFLIDREGVIRHRDIPATELADAVQQLLGANSTGSTVAKTFASESSPPSPGSNKTLSNMNSKTVFESKVDGTWREASVKIKRLFSEVMETRKFPTKFTFSAREQDFAPLAEMFNGRIPKRMIQFLAAISPNRDVDLGAIRFGSPDEIISLNAEYLPAQTAGESGPTFLRMATEGDGSIWAYDLKYGGVCLLDVATDFERTHESILDLQMEYFVTLADWGDFLRLRALESARADREFAVNEYDIAGSLRGDSTAVSVVHLPLWEAEWSEIHRMTKGANTVFVVPMNHLYQIRSSSKEEVVDRPVFRPATAAAAWHVLTNNRSLKAVTLQHRVPWGPEFEWSHAAAGTKPKRAFVTASPGENGLLHLNVPAMKISKKGERAVKFARIISEALALDTAEIIRAEPLLQAFYFDAFSFVPISDRSALKELTIDREILGQRSVGQIVLMSQDSEYDIVIRRLTSSYTIGKENDSHPILAGLIPILAEQLNKEDFTVEQLLSDQSVVTRCRLLDEKTVQIDVRVQPVAADLNP